VDNAGEESVGASTTSWPRGFAARPTRRSPSWCSLCAESTSRRPSSAYAATLRTQPTGARRPDAAPCRWSSRRPCTFNPLQA